MHVPMAVLNNFTNKNMQAQENSMIHTQTKVDEGELGNERGWGACCACVFLCGLWRRLRDSSPSPAVSWWCKAQLPWDKEKISFAQTRFCMLVMLLPVYHHRRTNACIRDSTSTEGLVWELGPHSRPQEGSDITPGLTWSPVQVPRCVSAGSSSGISLISPIYLKEH